MMVMEDNVSVLKLPNEFHKIVNVFFLQKQKKVGNCQT
jgi:hypothetical protein